MKKGNEQLTAILKKRKLKSTPMRMEVLSIMSESEKAVALSEIQKSLKNFDRVTLYRTINTFIDSGIVHKAMVDNQETYYALCSSDCGSHHHHDNHVHFKCTECNEVTCVESSSPLELSLKGHDIQHFEVKAVGICQACKA